VLSPRSHPTPPKLDKSVWTEADFEAMGWHDVAVHALATEAEDHNPGRLLIDLDYIVEWIPPTGDETYFSFWIVPATLVFNHAWDLAVDIALHSSALELDLDAITRTLGQPFGRSTWTLEGHNFTLAVTSEGFRQYLRTAPIWSSSQRLGIAQRGGISFDEEGYTE
jgi:hypothetical protein